MNNPEYFLTDVMREAVNATTQWLIDNPRQDEELFLPGFEINYRFGYITELNQVLQNWGKKDEFAAKKYPLVWLRNPYRVSRDEIGYYGRVEDCTLFILTNTDKNLLASERLEKVYKPILYPIYRRLMEELNNHPAIQYEYARVHTVVDRYYWGNDQQQEIGDAVDCLEIASLKLIIEDNQNC